MALQASYRVWATKRWCKLAFDTFGSMDATTYMDCWALSRTATQYISQALVDPERLNLSNEAASSDSVGHCAKTASVKHKSTALGRYKTMIIIIIWLKLLRTVPRLQYVTLSTLGTLLE